MDKIEFLQKHINKLIFKPTFPNLFDNNIPFPFETSVNISLSSSFQGSTI